ncbi:Rv1355c family protein [Nocardia sp. CDC159]|uniref:Rv1355c family protein n=1 Tax=Nocardia pulmonis TaxID=2951408 RepID=A0A9X2EAA7_9NOCA|nr:MULTISPECIES: Rv1355c family protein [Nocardia]MCM6777222.1 Rv1355c family protein [Nocardia pulmonis]MCM6790107.1 Rv1355c family protein [Nocardia sp. CDC159]
MADDHGPQTEYRPLILDQSNPAQARALAALRDDPTVEFTDLRDSIRAEYAAMTRESMVDLAPTPDRWIYYPWRRHVVALPGERVFRRVRLDRNRNKLTEAEQRILERLSIGVIGQSVGHAVAFNLALEGACGRLRLADFDALELSNLNRVSATLLDVGVNKAVVTARRIAELDPYLPVEVFEAGVDERTADAFVDGLSVLVEECDSLDIKVVVREAARERGIPVLMHTSDRGLLDVERYDLEPDRPLFHGLLGGLKAGDLRGLTVREKSPYVFRLLGAGEVSARMAASMIEVGETLTGWPQLGSDVVIGGASVAAAVRRIGLGVELRSGRTRIDPDAGLVELAQPPLGSDWAAVDDAIDADMAADPVGRVLHCAERAPSGGNVQPWVLRADSAGVRIALAPELSSPLDIGYRASAVAVGAALYNARTAAAAHGLLGAHRFLENTSEGPLVAILDWGSGHDEALADNYATALLRETSRHHGTGEPLGWPMIEALSAAAEAEGAHLRLATLPEEIAEAAALLGESDRVRYLTPRLHDSMFAELRWPGQDTSTGIDVRSLELAADEQAALEVGRRPEVMARLREWSGGAALGKYTRDRVRSSSAVVAVTLPDVLSDRPAGLSEYARAGMAVERVWIQAQRLGLAVQPVSPVFLYARRPEELFELSPLFADTLASLQGRFLDLLGVPEHETIALVLRLSYAAAASVRSRRRPTTGAAPRS